MNSTLSFSDCVDSSPLDPSKHVNFVHGMVLGQQDFQQEFAWHAGRHSMIARDLVGYGTVSGLAVTVEGQQVRVEPGLALTPAGQFARVRRDQCAEVGQWLARPENRSRTPEMLGSPGMLGVRVYVRLRYDSCLVDPVPIPGEPCRTEEEAMAASRIADSWSLQLSFDPPHQYEEDAIRELVHWFKRITLVEHPAATPLRVVKELRAAARDLFQSSDAPRGLELADPPADLLIARAELCECMRAALLVWTTELRPRAQERIAGATGGCGCAGDSAASPPEAATPERDVLLTELWVPVREVGSGVEIDTGTAIEPHEERRPYLLSVRMLQELVNCGPDATGAIELGSFATLLAESDTLLLFWVHHPEELDLGGPGALALTVNDVPVSDVSLSQPTGAANVFELRLDVSPAAPLQHGDRVALTIDVDATLERASGRSLGDALDRTRGDYVDHQGSSIVVRTIVGPLGLDDLLDVDGGGARDADVLTSRNGRWRPEPVPRNLGDLADVDVDSVSAADGQVLVLEDGRWQAKIPNLDDLGDVDAPAAPEDQVLTAKGGRWQPQPVPRNIDDLGDVDAPTAPEDQVLTAKGGRWRPEPVPRRLDDLTDVSVPAPAPVGQVLTFTGLQWEARPVPSGAPASPDDMHSGAIPIEGLKAGQRRLLGPIEHGFDKDRLVMVRLAQEEAEPALDFQEDTDSISIFLGIRVVAVTLPNTGLFVLLCENVRDERTNFLVRWFAIPVTKDFGIKDAPTLKSDSIPEKHFHAFARRIIAAEIANQNNKPEPLANLLGVPDQAEFKALLAATGFELVNGVVEFS